MRELWLGCSWEGAIVGLPLACQHWLRQYLADMAGLLSRMGIPFHIAFGTQLGAVRSYAISRPLQLSVRTGELGEWSRVLRNGFGVRELRTVQQAGS